MALHIQNTDNVNDSALLQLDGAINVTTAVVGGATYLFASAANDNAVSVFSIAADGALDLVDSVVDDGTLELFNPAEMTTAVIGGTTYLFVAGWFDDGVSVFSVAADGTLTNVDNVRDDATLQLLTAAAVPTAVIGGTTYLFVAGASDDGVSVFSVAADGTLSNVHNVSDDATLELDGAGGATTAVVDGTTYLFVAGQSDYGVSVFSVAADGTLTSVDNVSDDATLELAGADGITTAVIDGTTYLFVSGYDDDGVSVFSVAANGTLTNVDNVSDEGELELDFARDLRTAVIGGTTYLFVAGEADHGVSVFSVGADGTLTNVNNIRDDQALELNGALGVATAVINGTTHLFVAGIEDDGVSAFSIVGPPPPLGDVLWQLSDGTVATAAREFPRISSDWQIEGAADFDADGDADILWQHDDGRVVTWEMQDGQLLTNHNIAVGSGGWDIEHLGDFDGDGDADILWRSASGAVVTWEMEDGNLVRTHNVANASTVWRIDGIGDFDGDGDADILWRHTTAGAVVTWEMENDELVRNHNLPAAGNSWEIRGTGDFDGDGDADILWHDAGGAVVTWEMQGGEFVTHRNLPAVGTSWQIQGTEDFDSDGDADILWRNNDGTVVTWEMEDGALRRTDNFGQISNSWQIRGTGEFDLA
jgi:6-phosphogluconolactonase (cycloisomerase 2 family)